ncbi:PSD1 and planctomycete cytochrome C domain-containing protein [Stieleria sp. JC731]|uniref:PSD1 and planctomycete cytochrome C domain-containing protein n=1 Tax=Pirellulaceae TaxID=2691357 RepID=UPI001E4887B1|nr:PSD1 and planctomycete cytochrome C domain-containing protein [Stieleria sp. JC731]MCC9601891.1 PSD1 and planctomycete cytochrome C domain-containing protein [Stieleria sp. JC731]
MENLSRPSLGFIFWALIFCGLLFASALPVNADDSSSKNSNPGVRLFTLKVFPLLKEKCFGCHGDDPDDIRGQYNMLSREALIGGGESGDAAVIVGHPSQSVLIDAIRWEGYEMPPKENDRLTPAEISWIEEWIKSGAPWPNADTRNQILQEASAESSNADGVIFRTSGGTSSEWTYRRYEPNEIWAFKPVDPPQFDLPSGVNPIDFFVDRKIEEVGLQASGPAKPRQLLRRIYLDVTGLPPTIEESNSFAQVFAEVGEEAWNELIDRLLRSQHYGERQAQHWLDVVRYADTAGFSNDYERSNAWRYRDYVIRSFNDDKPFNEFVVEQIAGDELRPDDPEALIATGFLRMGPWGTAMVPQDEARQMYLDDLVHNVGQSFLAMPMRCCKCHDHKFDPIPTRDYYRMYSTFATTQPAELDAAFLPEENQGGFEKKRELVAELLEFAKAELKLVDDKQEAAAKLWYAEHQLPYKNEKERKDDPEDQKPPRHIGLTPEEKGIKKVREQDVWIWERRLERYEPMAQAVYSGQDDWKNSRKLRKANKINQQWRPENFILQGGNLGSKGDPVRPGVLSACGIKVNESAELPWALPDGLDGRRLAFAQWVVDDRNPLTARVIVNRVWQWHFGKGIVKTANNFGVKGSKPTHPELLDWLTADFIEHGWKLKRLHRQILSSKTYRRSTAPVDVETTKRLDPEDRFLASFRPRRMSAEEIRDGVLFASGELRTEMGGVPIMPEINMEVALQPRMIQFSIAPAHQPSRTPEERNRRTIYAYRVRGQADPFLEVLNQPNPNESCELRDVASVSPQAFTLLNSDAMTDRSIAVALRIEREHGIASNSDNIFLVNRAVELALGRRPSDSEQQSFEGYLAAMQNYHQNHHPEIKHYPTEVTRSLVEEFTGEPFEFIEKLNVYKDYVPDAKPWTVSAKTRALADLCLLLINSNEFMYVY